MVSYEAEGNGRLFQDMVPNKELALSQTSLGSKKELELHTEQAFSEMRPDYLSLACLKGDIYAKFNIQKREREKKRKRERERKQKREREKEKEKKRKKEKEKKRQTAREREKKRRKALLYPGTYMG